LSGASLIVRKCKFFTKALLGKLRGCEKQDFLDKVAALVGDPLKEFENYFLRSTSLALDFFNKKKNTINAR
jgi:hypothetical protein